MTGGIINVCKPGGLTSHDVVDRVREILEMRRVGHGGTLDPLAEGVLLVGFGAGTKILQYLSDLSKSYEATLRLGEETDTMDSEGRTILRRPVPPLKEDEIRKVLLSFIGPRKQRPPAYSAVKIGGVPAYRLARQGKKVTLPPRPITVEALSLLGWNPPDLKFSTRVSKGTYIRKLACELAAVLGSCGHLVSLTRTAVGRHTISDSYTLESLEEAAPDGLGSAVLTLPAALDHLPRVLLDERGTLMIKRGQLPAGNMTVTTTVDAGSLMAAVDPSGDLSALLRSRSVIKPGLEEEALLTIERVIAG